MGSLYETIIILKFSIFFTVYTWSHCGCFKFVINNRCVHFYQFFSHQSAHEDQMAVISAGATIAQHARIRFLRLRIQFHICWQLISRTGHCSLDVSDRQDILNNDEIKLTFSTSAQHSKGVFVREDYQIFVIVSTKINVICVARIDHYASCVLKNFEVKTKKWPSKQKLMLF